MSLYYVLDLCPWYLPPLVFPYLFFFFFNDTATTEIYTLSLHDALPIYLDDAWTQVEEGIARLLPYAEDRGVKLGIEPLHPAFVPERSEEHTSELQSRQYLVCRLLLEKKKTYAAQAQSPLVVPADVTLLCPGFVSLVPPAPRLSLSFFFFF